MQSMDQRHNYLKEEIAEIQNNINFQEKQIEAKKEEEITRENKLDDLEQENLQLDKKLRVTCAEM